MLDSIISERYAKALFELAIENKKLEEVRNDMGLLLDVIMSNRDFKHLLVNPVVRPEKKYAVFSALFKTEMQEVTLRFFHLIMQKRREKYLEGIARAFIARYKEHHNIVTVEIRTVAPLSEELRKKIISLIERRRDITVDLVEVIDTNIIGGFIVSTENVRYDASLTTSIKKLKKEFEENLYVREF